MDKPKASDKLVKKGFQYTSQKTAEKAYLLGVRLPRVSSASAAEHLDELEQLALTAGAEVLGKSIQNRTRVDGATFIGPGKAEAVREICEQQGINVVVLDDDLSPAQARNLEKILKVKVIDRTELILDIFARHAKSKQARVQVELAQLIYALPRLRRLWDHLSRQQGGIGTRGPGETQLEVDRRRINERIGQLKRQLKMFDQRKVVLRESRNGFPVVALVGYTNAGKSTLMNAMTGANTLAQNQLFATLDTLTRKAETGKSAPFLVVDTVGFIRKLPHHLVDSFKATLGDIADADLCLHVIDASHPGFVEQKLVADRTLQLIKGADAGTLYAFNKIDRLDEDALSGLQQRYPDAIFISAAKRVGLDDLNRLLEKTIYGDRVTVEVKIRNEDGEGIAKVKELLKTPESSLEDGHCVFTGSIASRLIDRLEDVADIEIRYLL